MGFLRHSNDELLDIFCGIAKHLVASRVRIEVCRPIDGLNRTVGIATAIFELCHHAGN